MKNNNEKNEKKNLPGYPEYPEQEDIYYNMKEVDEDPENLSKDVNTTGKKDINNPKQVVIPQAEELDVPGSELDDDMEAAGNSDEENNYYSLGGDKHDE